MEKKKHLTYPSNKNTQTQKSKEKSHHKEVLSIYKIQKPLSANISDTETQSSYMTCQKNFINVQKLYSKHFQKIYVENQNKDHLTIIDDFIQSNFLNNQDYATSQTISTAEAFRFSSNTQNLKRFYTLNSKQKIQNLEHNLSLAIKNDKEFSEHHILVHFQQNFYNIFLKNSNKHKKFKQNATKNKNSHQLEKNNPLSLQKNFKQSLSKQNKQENILGIKRNYQKVLEKMNLSKYSMKDVSLTQNNQTKDFINLVHQLKIVFSNKNKQRKLKSHEKLNKLKSFKQNSSKSHKKFTSSCKSSRNSFIQNPQRLKLQKQNPFLTQRSSPVKYTKNFNQNLYFNFQEKDSKIISSIYLPQNTNINSSSNQKIKQGSKNKKIRNCEKLEKLLKKNKINQNDTQTFMDNVYCLPSYGSKISKTSTVTPKVFSQYPSEINIQQKPFSITKALVKYDLKENDFIIYQSPFSSHTSTPKVKILNGNKLSADKTHKVKINQKNFSQKQVSQKKGIQQKKSLSKLSTQKKQKNKGTLNMKCSNNLSKSKEKNIKKLIFNSYKQNLNRQQNQYGINKTKSKKFCTVMRVIKYK